MRVPSDVDDFPVVVNFVHSREIGSLAGLTEAFQRTVKTLVVHLVAEEENFLFFVFAHNVSVNIHQICKNKLKLYYVLQLRFIYKMEDITEDLAIVCKR